MTSSTNKNLNMTSGVSISEMHGHAPAAAKDTWIFNAEATSTLLIAAWYIFGVYITLGIIPKNAFYEWGAHWVISFLLGVLVFCGLYALGFHAGGAFAPFWIPVNAITCLIACYPLPVFVMWVLSYRQTGLHRLPQPLSARFIRQIAKVVLLGLWGYARRVNQEEYERSMPEPLMLPTQANDHPENGTFSPLLKRA